jgi:hypothetical protein
MPIDGPAVVYSNGVNFPESDYAAFNIAARHWQTDCMAEPTSKFESVMRRAPPTEKDAALAPGAGAGEG